MPLTKVAVLRRRRPPTMVWGKGGETPLARSAYTEHLGTTRRTGARCRGFAILHGYGLGVADFFLRPAFDTISFHPTYPSF